MKGVKFPHREREQAICSTWSCGTAQQPTAMRCGVGRLWAGRLCLWAESPLSYLAALRPTRLSFELA